MTDRPFLAGLCRHAPIALLLTGSIWPHVVLAQSSDSATIDATATLSAAPPVLTLKPVDNLRFGTVQIPSLASVQCTYQVEKGTVLSVLEDGKVTGSTTCQYLDSAQATGRVLVNCEAGLSLEITATPSTTSSDPGVRFLTGSEFVASNPTEGTAGFCRADGTMDIELGGQLLIDGTATPIDAETAIGRILLEVQYNSGEGCQYCV